MASARTRLYGSPISHPCQAARLMLERAGIPFEMAQVPMGIHPLILRARGFPGSTVPAMDWDGRKIQGSRAISRAIEAHGPPGILFPVEPEARERVEEAEAWGERELQAIARRLFRWGLANHGWLRKAMADQFGLPAPTLSASLIRPMAARFARVSGADEAAVLADRARLSSLLDRVDALIADGTIGGAEPNAADYQIGTSIRAMMAFTDLATAIAGRPAEALARRILPEYAGPVPRLLPDPPAAAQAV